MPQYTLDRSAEHNLKRRDVPCTDSNEHCRRYIGEEGKKDSSGTPRISSQHEYFERVGYVETVERACVPCTYATHN